MARINSKEITRRAAPESRATASPQLTTPANLDSARGYSALGNVASETLGRFGDISGRALARKAAKTAEEDTIRGNAARTKEAVEGAPVRSQEELAAQTSRFRQGYFATEGANRIQGARLALTKTMATLEPGTDPSEAIEAAIGNLTSAPEFQDPAVLKQMQPEIERLRQGALEVHGKAEVAEIFERQSENLRTIARDGIADGSLRTADGVARFRAALDTEQFAYLQRDDADDIMSNGYLALLEGGTIDPTEMVATLQEKIPGDDVPLWDRVDANGNKWADRFETAARSGTAVRAKQLNEAQAEAQSTMEPALQDRAGSGRLATAEIYETAAKLGLDGKEKFTFVRHWFDQNQAGQRRIEAEAKAAARHKETIMAINAGNILSSTTADLQKSADKEFAAAVGTGDTAQMASVIGKYTRNGIMIPQLKDMMSRTSRSTLTANYALYQNLVKADPVLADSYLTDENAVLYSQHHDNITKFGMKPEESIAMLPVGAGKGERAAVSAVVGKAGVSYFKTNTTMADGSPRPPWLNARVTQQAIALGVNNADADPAYLLKIAERRVQSTLMPVNGRWVARGGARTGTGPAIEAFVKIGAKDAVAAGAVPADMQDGVFAAPSDRDPNVFVMRKPNGFPVVNPKTGKPVTFDPNEVAASKQRYDGDRAAAETEFKATEKAAKSRDTNQGYIDAAAARGVFIPGKPVTKVPASNGAVNFNPAAKPAGNFVFPEFLDYLHSNRTKPSPGK